MKHTVKFYNDLGESFNIQFTTEKWHYSSELEGRIRAYRLNFLSVDKIEWNHIILPITSEDYD